MLCYSYIKYYHRKDKNNFQKFNSKLKNEFKKIRTNKRNAE